MVLAENVEKTKTRCIESMSDLLKRKVWSSIKQDRTPSSFTTHSQPIVSRRLSRWKLEKSYTGKCMRHPGRLRRFLLKIIGWKHWIQKLLEAAKTPNESNQNQKPNYQERRQIHFTCQNFSCTVRTLNDVHSHHGSRMCLCASPLLVVIHVVRIVYSLTLCSSLCSSPCVSPIPCSSLPSSTCTLSWTSSSMWSTPRQLTTGTPPTEESGPLAGFTPLTKNGETRGWTTGHPGDRKRYLVWSRRHQTLNKNGETRGWAKIHPELCVNAFSNCRQRRRSNKNGETRRWTIVHPARGNRHWLQSTKIVTCSCERSRKFPRSRARQEDRKSSSSRSTSSRLAAK